MVRFTDLDLQWFIEVGIIIYPCRVDIKDGSKRFYFPRGNQSTREWGWIKLVPQMSVATVQDYLSKGYDLAGILTESVAVLDCDDRAAFETVFDLVNDIGTAPVVEKSYSYSEVNQKHHFFFKAENVPYCKRFTDIGLLGKGELLGVGHLLLLNKTGWYISPSDQKLSSLPLNIGDYPKIITTSPMDQCSFSDKGQRNIRMASVAGGLRRHGIPEQAIYECLMVINMLNVPPLEDTELRSIAKSISRYPPDMSDIEKGELVKNKLKGVLQ